MSKLRSDHYQPPHGIEISTAPGIRGNVLVQFVPDASQRVGVNGFTFSFPADQIAVGVVIHGADQMDDGALMKAAVDAAMPRMSALFKAYVGIGGSIVI